MISETSLALDISEDTITGENNKKINSSDNKKMSKIILKIKNTIIYIQNKYSMNFDLFKMIAKNIVVYK